MVDAYVSLDTLKSSGALNITGTGDDSRLLALIESMSRLIDRYCNRQFYVLSATRTFDGEGTSNLLVPDLISVDASGLKSDEDKDRTFELTWATTDYLLLPSNADPTTSSNPQSRPYTRIEVDVDAGTRSVFPLGQRTVQIAGKWGWWQHLKRATETANAVADATTTSVAVSSRADVEAGHTLLIDSEQLYVSSYTGNTLTVVRGVNGTTAASHSGGAAIDIYEYPQPVAEATILQTSRLWRRKDAAFSDAVGMPDTGLVRLAGGLDADVRLMLGQYRKLPVGVGT